MLFVNLYCSLSHLRQSEQGFPESENWIAFTLNVIQETIQLSKSSAYLVWTIVQDSIYLDSAEAMDTALRVARERAWASAELKPPPTSAKASATASTRTSATAESRPSASDEAKPSPSTLAAAYHHQHESKDLQI